MFVNFQISTRVVGNIVFDILMGVDAKAFEPKSEFIDQAVNQFTTSPYAGLWNIIYSVFPFIRSIYPSRFTSEQFTAWFTDVFTHAIKMREEQKITREDYLNFLIDLRNRKNLSYEVLCSYAYTYFLDGFITTSHFLASALNQLSKNSKCQEKLRAEVKNHSKVSYDDLHQMQYMDSVLNGNLFVLHAAFIWCYEITPTSAELDFVFLDFFALETTRMEPFQIMFWKTCTESIQLEDSDGTSVTIEKGTKVTLPMLALHKHPDYYPNAEEFDPERFDHNSDSAKKLKEAGVFLPFGNGPRACLGKILGNLLRAFDIDNMYKMISCDVSRNALCSYFDQGHPVYSCQQLWNINESWW